MSIFILFSFSDTRNVNNTEQTRTDTNVSVLRRINAQARSTNNNLQHVKSGRYVPLEIVSSSSIQSTFTRHILIVINKVLQWYYQTNLEKTSFVCKTFTSMFA